MRPLPPIVSLSLALGGLLGFSLVSRLLSATNPTTAALGLLVIVLAASALSRQWVAVVSSFVAALCLNYFFVPPVGTFSVADSRNWVSLAAFVIVGVVASRLSMAADARANEAVARRKELGRLFDLSRDVLLTEEGLASLAPLARHIARRFELRRAALFLPSRDGGWQAHQGAPESLEVPPDVLNTAFARASATLEFDARDRAYGGQVTLSAGAGEVRLVPLRLGTRTVGLFGAPAELEAGTADAVAGLAAIAIERSQLLSERKDAELARQKGELAAALLASMSHDLRTPLTAIGVAVDNLDDEAIAADQRRLQVKLAQSELQRLNRLFRDILDMARIEAAAVPIQPEWVTAADVIDAACANLRPELENRRLTIDADETVSVFVDPRLTTAALSHLVENALQHAPGDHPIEVRGSVDDEGLHLSVRDHGPGLDAQDLDQLFERFYRGRQTGRTTPGSGMGLAITRGLLAVERGRVWGSNMPDGGAMFSIVVPAASRPVESEV